MRIVLFFIIVSISQALALESYAQSKRLSLDIENQPIQQILDEIEEQSEFFFMYDATVVDVYQKRSIDCKNQTINKILDKLLKDSGIAYKIEDRQVALSSIARIESFQQISVSGKVTDSGGQPLPGVTVVVKGTTTGTVTNVDGEYNLSGIPGDATLVFSFVGMKTQEVVVGNQSSINIAMEEETFGIEEVIAVGYGTRGKKSITGAIEDVNIEPILNRSNSNFIVNLQGSIPGLVVTRKQGDPGDEKADFQIRGTSSINTTNPLVVIDDIPYDDHSVLSTLNASDIEQFSVLKDAAAASLYGARAAGGVILITTKKGKKGITKVSYNGKVSADYLGLETTPCTQAQFYTMYNEASILDGINNHRFKPGEEFWLNGKEGTGPSPFYDSVDFTFADRKFVNEMWQNFALTHSHYLDISGGSDKSLFNISLGYINADGLQAPAKNNYERMHGRLNYDFNFSEKFKVSTSVYIEKGKKDKPTLLDDVFRGGNDIYWYTLPTIAYLNPAGQNYGFGGTTDPIAMLKLGGRTIQINNKLNLRAKLSYKIIDGLFLNTLVSNNIAKAFIESNTNIITYWDWSGTIINKQRPNRNQIRKDYGETIFQNYSMYLNFSKTIRKHHNITAMVGASYEKDNFTDFSAWRLDLLTEELSSLQLGDPDEQYNTSSENAWALASFFGRFNYSHKNKYLFEATIRRDGSSRFIEDRRWDNFGGVSIGWNIAEENFFKFKKNELPRGRAPRYQKRMSC